MADLSQPGRARTLDVARVRQAWTIAKIELRRAFFAKRGLWVYALALLPAVIFLGHALDTTYRRERLARHGLAQPAMLDGIREGEAVDDVKNRLGRPAAESWSVRTRRVRQRLRTPCSKSASESRPASEPVRNTERLQAIVAVSDCMCIVDARATSFNDALAALQTIETLPIFVEDLQLNPGGEAVIASRAEVALAAVH